MLTRCAGSIRFIFLNFINALFVWINNRTFTWFELRVGTINCSFAFLNISYSIQEILGQKKHHT